MEDKLGNLHNYPMYKTRGSVPVQLYAILSSLPMGLGLYGSVPATVPSDQNFMKIPEKYTGP